MLNKFFILIHLFFISLIFAKDLKIDVECESNNVSFILTNEGDSTICVHTPSTIDFVYDDFIQTIYFIPDCRRKMFERTDPYSITCIPKKAKRKVELMNEFYLDLFTTMNLDKVNGFYFLEGDSTEFVRFLSKNSSFSQRDCRILNEMFSKKTKKYVKKQKCK